MSDDEYEIPLVDQRYFGAGIKRKRINFVPPAEIHSRPETNRPTSSAADRYLSIVLDQPAKRLRKTSSDENFESLSDGKFMQAEAAAPSDTLGHQNVICDICGRCVVEASQTQRHELSVMHQICLKHSYPPSHIDRNSKALAVLQNQGWDPDSRLGLGVTGGGILHPLKAKDNPSHIGLGAVLAEVQVKPKAVKLDAGKTRRLEGQIQHEKAKLRELFYQNEDIDRYLTQK